MSIINAWKDERGFNRYILRCHFPAECWPDSVAVQLHDSQSKLAITYTEVNSPWTTTRFIKLPGPVQDNFDDGKKISATAHCDGAGSMYLDLELVGLCSDLESRSIWQLLAFAICTWLKWLTLAVWKLLVQLASMKND